MGRGSHHALGRSVRRLQQTERAVLSAALALLLPVPATGPALAATFVVTTTQDAPHTTPLDGNCTSTLPANPCTLRAAVQAANFLGNVQTINLQAAGTYVLTVTGQDEQNAATGDLNINGVNLTINNTSGGVIAIDGNNTDRVFYVATRAAAQLTISNVTIQHGASIVQGAVLVDGRPTASLTMSNSTVRDNAGGGIYASSPTFGQPPSNVTLTNVTIADNQGSAISALAPVTITGGSITGNTGPVQGFPLTMTGTTVSNNGGGIFTATGNANLLASTIANSTITNNGSPGVSYSGGVAGATLSITNTTISGNRGSAGAGLSIDGGAVTLSLIHI